MLRFRRDPFARTEMIRETIKNKHVISHFVCSWCGNSKLRMYRYGIERDSGKIGWASGMFCDVNCYSSFYGV